MLLKEFPYHPHLWELQSLLMQLGLSQLSLPSIVTVFQWEQLLLPQVRLMTIKYKFFNIISSCCFHNFVFFFITIFGEHGFEYMKLPEYEARTLFGLGVSDTDTCNYTELCDFFKLLVVLACQCLCRVRCPCLYPCFTYLSCLCNLAAIHYYLQML